MKGRKTEDIISIQRCAIETIQKTLALQDHSQRSIAESFTAQNIILHTSASCPSISHHHGAAHSLQHPHDPSMLVFLVSVGSVKSIN